jgi:iron complex transport system substrate-binding protein
MLFRHPAFSLAAGLVALLPYCVSAAEIAHELGTTEVPNAPQRVIALEFSFVDALAALGVPPVGIADDKKRERIVAEYTSAIGNDWQSVGTRKTPSLEVIASLQPDLIIADKTRHAGVYETLSQIAPTIVLDSLGGTYPDAIEQTLVIGDALGMKEKAVQRVAEHEAAMDELIAQIGNGSSGVTAQFGVTNATGLWLHSPLSYNGSLLGKFGFSSSMVPKDGEVYETNYVPTTLEQLSVVDPDLLILGKYADPALTDSWKGEVLYDDLKAVQAGNVYTVTAHNWSRMRGLLAAEMTARDVLDILADIAAKK